MLLSSLVLCARLIPDGHLPGLELPRNIGPFAEAGGFKVGSLFNGYPSHSASVGDERVLRVESEIRRNDIFSQGPNGILRYTILA